MEWHASLLALALAFGPTEPRLWQGSVGTWKPSSSYGHVPFHLLTRMYPNTRYSAHSTFVCLLYSTAALLLLCRDNRLRCLQKTFHSWFACFSLKTIEETTVKQFRWCICSSALFYLLFLSSSLMSSFFIVHLPEFVFFGQSAPPMTFEAGWG